MSYILFVLFDLLLSLIIIGEKFSSSLCKYIIQVFWPEKFPLALKINVLQRIQTHFLEHDALSSA